MSGIKEAGEMELHQKAIEITRGICKNYGSDYLEERAFELEHDDYEKYRAECKKLVDVIVKLVKLQEKPFDIESLKGEVKDEGFWREIEEDVGRLTVDFLRVLPFRKAEKEKRRRILAESFDIIYLQYENKKYLEDIIKDDEIVEAVYEILMASEYMIVEMYASKRRFQEFLAEYLCLEEEDMELIWNLYQQEFASICSMVSMRNTARAARRMNYLSKKMDDLEDMLLLALDELDDRHGIRDLMEES